MKKGPKKSGGHVSMLLISFEREEKQERKREEGMESSTPKE